MDEKEINRFLLEEEIYRSFCAQLVKDFDGSGLDSSLLEGMEHDAAAARQVILQAVTALSKGGEEKLRRLLYRVDISERQLNNYYRTHSNQTFEEIVAELIVRRILQKVVIRKRFSHE